MAERFRALVGAAIFLAVADAHALSIGTARGDAVVGQSLDLGFDLALDAGADAAAACVSADLFYGDTRIDPSRVRVVTRPGSQPLQASVQIVSNVPVNEPVVSVVLRAGCSPTVSRRFVVLSSSPVEAASAAAAGVRPLATSGGGRSVASSALPVLPPVVTAPVAGISAPAAGGRNAAVESPAPAKRAAAPRRSASPTNSTAPAVATTTARGARLELQSPSEWLQEQVLPLRTSDTMASPPLTTTAEQRAAAAALWRSLGGVEGAPAVDVESEQRVQALEKQVKTLQNNARMARSREAELQGQLSQAQSSSETSWMALWAALGLIGMGAVVGGLLAWRRRGALPLRWRRRADASVFGDDAVTAFGEGFVDTQPAPVDFLYPLEEPVLQSQFPNQPGPASPPVAASAAPAQAPDSAPGNAAGFGASRLPVDEPASRSNSADAAMRAARELRNGSANDLADVQQNADFFASLGQYEQAIELLQDYIASHPGTSPVAYLDLLKLFHTLSETEPYRKLRGDFNAVFNADVPPFAGFLKTTKDLSAYNDVLQRISQVWTVPEVLDLIESLLVRHSGEGAHPPFQLEAYRDLLLLYEIAKIEHGAGPGVKLSVPPAIAPPPAPPPAPVASPVTVVAPVFASQPKVQQEVKLDLEVEPDARFFEMAPDLGVALEFGTTSPRSVDDHVSLDDMAAPDTELPTRNTSSGQATDPHIIDFDMFDVALPPIEKEPKR